MKRAHKYYKYKKILKRIREANKEIENSEKYYFKHNGYMVRMTIKRKARKHPLYKELKQILPLIAPEIHVKTTKIGPFVSKPVRKDLYLKLSPLQKACLLEARVPVTESYPGCSSSGKWEASKYYILDPSLEELLVPCVTKYYEKAWSFYRCLPLSKKLERDNIWAYVSKHEREHSKLGRKAKHKKALINQAIEEIKELL